MRNLLLAAMAAFAALGAGLGGAMGQSSDDDNDRWMRIVNNSDFDAIGVYIMPLKDDDSCCWSHDLLGDTIDRKKYSSKTLKPDVSQAFVKLDDGSGACNFHIRIATKYPGWEWFFDSIDVCNKSNERDRVLTLGGGAPNDKKKVSQNPRLVKVENRSRLAIQHVFIIPSREPCCWSRDLFPADGKPSAPSNLVNFDEGSGKCEFDIRITSDNKDLDWYFFGFDACRNKTLTLVHVDKRTLVTITNKSSFRATRVLARPKDGTWSGDLLGNYIIPPGQSLNVDFGDRAGTCEFDYRVIKSGGLPWTKKINACSEPPAELPKIELTYDPKGGKRRLVTIKNESGSVAVTAQVRPEGGGEWSVDLLGDEVIPEKQSLVVDFDIDVDTCSFEYRITKERGEPWVGKFNACSDPPAPLPTLPLS